MTNPQEITLDLDQVFMLYTAFAGDVQRTAHSSGITPEQVQALADQHGWPEKIDSIVKLTKGEKPGDVERAVNRAMNFVQAHRCRIFVEAVLRALLEQAKACGDPLQLLRVPRVDKTGHSLGAVYSTRPIADLASAMEKIHCMTYAALNDSPQERAKRAEKPAAETAQADVHARMSAALAKMRTVSPAAQLEDAQEELGQHLAKAIKSKNV
jgi:hypothetical protein